jgi:DNA-directed RNA polymerase specialized sigma24 family protein
VLRDADDHVVVGSRVTLRRFDRWVVIGPGLLGYARGKGAPDPEDVMQDVLVAAASRIGGFVGGMRAFRSWVFAIAYRQIADRDRAPRRTEVELRDRPDRSAGPEEAVVAGASAASSRLCRVSTRVPILPAVTSVP